MEKGKLLAKELAELTLSAIIYDIMCLPHSVTCDPALPAYEHSVATGF